MGRAARENFRVASRLLPATTRSHLLAFYGYARLVDQLGDAYPGDRGGALDWAEDETRAALVTPDLPGLHPLVSGAARSVRATGADPASLFKLIAANRQDQEIGGYATFDALLAYCELSANPIGRLVLDAFGATSTERAAWSDRICTGLQLAEHWQDIAEDAAAGRVYIPAEDLERFGVGHDELTAGPPATPALRGLVAFEVARARRLLNEGAPLIGSLHGRVRFAVAGFWAGGQAALDAVAHRGFDPLGGAPRPAGRRVATHLVSAMRAAPAAGEAA